MRIRLSDWVPGGYIIWDDVDKRWKHWCSINKRFEDYDIPMCRLPIGGWMIEGEKLYYGKKKKVKKVVKKTKIDYLEVL